MLKVYETNIGIATPLVVENLNEIKSTYPSEWFVEAMREAVSNEVRNLNYVKAILARWKSDGFKSSRKQYVSSVKRTYGNGTSTASEMEADERRLGITPEMSGGRK